MGKKIYTKHQIPIQKMGFLEEKKIFSWSIVSYGSMRTTSAVYWIDFTRKAPAIPPPTTTTLDFLWLVSWSMNDLHEKHRLPDGEMMREGRRRGGEREEKSL